MVDDNRTNRRILEEILNNWGTSPSTVSDGPAALDAIRQAETNGSPFAMAVIDGMMPGMDGFELASTIRLASNPSPPLLIMLTSSGLSDESERAQAIGVSACLTKPIRQSELFDAMMKALGSPGSGPSVVEARTVPVEVPTDKTVRPLRILLAEDHIVNQKVAVGMLERMGHRATVVADGAKAVEAWETTRFDMILMDVQMPEMDGFEAVAAIRERERQTGHHIPIAALTAHAMKGDRERCLNSGFDDYLTKPIRSRELGETIGRWAARNPDRPEVDTDGPTSAPTAEFDRETALLTVGGDKELLGEVVGLFLDDCPRLLSEIEQAIDMTDGPSIKRLAHTVKGLAGNFGLPTVGLAACLLESKGLAGSWGEARSAFEELRVGINRIRPVLEAVAASP